MATSFLSNGHGWAGCHPLDSGGSLILDGHKHMRIAPAESSTQLALCDLRASSQTAGLPPLTHEADLRATRAVAVRCALALISNVSHMASSLSPDGHMDLRLLGVGGQGFRGREVEIAVDGQAHRRAPSKGMREKSRQNRAK